MNILKYRAELSDDKRNILVREAAYDYDHGNWKTPQEIVDFLKTVFKLHLQAEEFLFMIAFNTKMKPLGVFEVSHGTVNGTYCQPRELFIRALLCGATSIVLAHNHPSGECEPSKEDMAMTKRILDAGEIIGVKCLDHIIIGKDTYLSGKECMKLQWDS